MEAEALRSRAAAELQLGHPQTAERLLGRALTLVGTEEGPKAEQTTVAIRVTRAYALVALKGQDKALVELAEARHRAQRIHDLRLIALCDIQEGAINVWCGDWSAAATALERVPLDSGVLTDTEVATTLLNRGLAHTSLLDLARGRRDLHRAVDVSTRRDLPVQRFKALHNLGCLEYFASNVPEALRLMREADQIPVSVDRSRARLDRARVLADAGLLDQAMDILTTALASAGAIERGDIHLDLAYCHLLRNDLREARAHAGSASRHFTGRQAWSRREEAQLMRALVDVLSGSPPSASTRLVLRTATSASRPRTPHDRLMVRIEAEFALRRRKTATARSCVDRLARGPRQPVGLVLHERQLRARTLLAEGRARQARRVLRDASDLLARHQGGVVSLDLRAALAVHGRGIRDEDVSLSLGRGRPADVFDSVERWRAASQRAPLALAPPDQRSTELLAELRKTRHLVATGDISDDDRVRAHMARLETEIATRTWATVGVGDSGPTLRTARVADLRDTTHDGVVLSFFTLDDRSYATWIRDGSAGLRDLGASAEVEALVSRTVRDLRARAHVPPVGGLAESVDRALSSSLTALDDALALRSVVAGASRVVVVPTASLSAVPWGILSSLRGVPVTVAPSVTRWHRHRATPSHVGSVDALAGPGLRHAADEVDMVVDAWGPGGSSSRAARADDVVTALGRAAVVHIAAHGRHEHQSPLFSTLAMADGPVFAHELPRPAFADHVVLSACDVGRSQVRPGDEPLGLTTALLGMGVRAVVASVAPVRDGAAAEAMTSYHRLLAGGEDAAASLASVLERHPQAGAFCLYGADWSGAA
jgi:CHAT domain-containing protein/tetratricopeptide (TPR) repeat protein